MNETDTIIIEDIGVKNWSEYKTIRLRALKEVPQAFGASFQEESEYPDEKWIERAKQIEDRIRYGVIAKENNIPLGLMGASIQDVGNTKTANIISVFVTPEARGKGVATKMMSSILEKIKNNPDIKKVTLTVNVDQSSAIKLYEKFGFKVESEEKDILGDGLEHTEYIMELSI